MLTAVTSEGLRRRVRERRLPTLVLFFGSWCPYCRSFRPTWQQWARKLDAEVMEVSLEYDGPEWDEWRVEVVPTVAAFVDGVEKGRKIINIGPEDLEHLLALASGSPPG